MAKLIQQRRRKAHRNIDSVYALPLSVLEELLRNTVEMATHTGSISIRRNDISREAKTPYTELVPKDYLSFSADGGAYILLSSGRVIWAWREKGAWDNYYASALTRELRNQIATATHYRLKWTGKRS